MTRTRIRLLPLFLFLLIAMTGCRCGDCETDKTLSVAERINCLESWFHQSRDDLYLMRATTTLALTRSDGYALFSDPNPLPTPDHLHNWYPFWDADLGVPVAEGRRQDDGSVTRSFSNGTVIYNPMGNETVSISFPEVMLSVATGQSATEHRVPSADGDILLRVR